MDLRNQQIKDSYGNLVTIGTTLGAPTTGFLQNGQGSNVTALTMTSTTLEGGLVVNELGANADFRVEGVGDANLLFVDASTARVGIGTNAPASLLDVDGDLTIADKIIHSGDTNTAIRFPAADTVTVETAGTERLRIDSAGNVGIAVTPSAWASTFKALQIGAGGAVYAQTNLRSVYLSSNLYFDGTNYIYISTEFATFYRQFQGAHTWYTAPSGTAGDPITFTERFKIGASETVVNDASADHDFRVEGDTDANLLFVDASTDRVGIGTSSPATRLEISGDRTSIIRLTNTRVAESNDQILGQVQFYGNDTTPSAGIRSAIKAFTAVNGGGSYLTISTADGTTNDIERLRITSDGYLRMASGTGGIQFGGDTAAANALDDYEEGTWTPTVSGVSVGTGVFTKIGRIALIECLITANSVSTNTIDGLPFSGSTASGYGGGTIGRQVECDVLDANGVPVRAIVTGSSIQFRENTVNGSDALFTITTSASGTVRLGITSWMRV